MTRRLRTLALAVSLVVCLLTVGLLVRSLTKTPEATNTIARYGLAAGIIKGDASR